MLNDLFHLITTGPFKSCPDLHFTTDYTMYDCVFDE